MKASIIKKHLFVVAVIFVISITFTPYIVKSVFAGAINMNDGSCSLTGFQWTDDWEGPASKKSAIFNGRTMEDFMDQVWDLSFDMVYPKALGNWLEDLMEDLQDPFFDWMEDSQRFFWGHLWASWISNQHCGALNWPGFGFPKGLFLNQWQEFTVGQTYEGEFPVDGQEALNVEAINGEVVIRGQEDTDSVWVTAYLSVGSDSEEDAEINMNNLEILVTVNDNQINIETVEPEDFDGRSYKIEYEIIVPSYFEVMISQDNGRIAILDIENNVDVWNSNGSVLLSNIVGGITAGVDNGSIKGVMVLSNGEKIDMSTTNGGIELRLSSTSTSAEIFARVVNGEISVSNLDIGDLVKKRKRLTGMIGAGEGAIKLNTVNGNIAVIGFD